MVAGEVRALAQRSAQAKEIKALIEQSVAQVRDGSGQVRQAGGTMHDVVQAIQRVADMIGEVTAAASELEAKGSPRSMRQWGSWTRQVLKR